MRTLINCIYDIVINRIGVDKKRVYVNDLLGIDFDAALDVIVVTTEKGIAYTGATYHWLPDPEVTEVTASTVTEFMRNSFEDGHEVAVVINLPNEIVINHYVKDEIYKEIVKYFNYGIQ